MGGMKSGTGDVWGDDKDDDEPDAVEESDDEGDDEPDAVEESDDMAVVEGDEDSVGSGRDDDGEFPDADARREVDEEAASREDGSSEHDQGKDIADSAISSGRGSDRTSSGERGGGGKQPYVVRRMLKDRSVQFERDERLTLFVHDDVKAGEQELEAAAQELFGRDIPVFDIREAVYRAALRNREDVVDELEEMGYTRE